MIFYRMQKLVKLDNSRGDIKDILPLMKEKELLLSNQDMIIAPQKEKGFGKVS